MSITVKRGWVSEVNGIPVKKVPAKYRGGRWPNGNPIGILWHYTAGCNASIVGTLNLRKVSAHFNVSREGTIEQYVKLTRYAYHAYGASRVYWGIEHAILPGTCAPTTRQLVASARLAAGLVEYTERKWNFRIPLRKTDGPDLVPGFKDHKDGTKETWNPNVHVDGLVKWSWANYLQHVKEHLPKVYVYKSKRYTLRALMDKLRTRLREGRVGDVHDIRVKVIRRE